MRILLAEDESDIGSAIEKSLHHHKYVVDWVRDGNEAWNYLVDFQSIYTLAILDWMLPGLSGIELCQRLRKQANPLPVLILTARDSMADKVTGLDAGADDYLVKPFGIEELLARIRALQRRAPTIQASVLQVGPLHLDYTTSTVSIHVAIEPIHPIQLTAKEFQLLEYFMQHPQQVLSAPQIRDRLWEVKAEASSNVVAAQIRLLRRKLTTVGCDHMIENLRGIGYRLNLSSYAIE
jgi:DNA-binding response OmpR family regulator